MATIEYPGGILHGNTCQCGGNCPVCKREEKKKKGKNKKVEDPKYEGYCKVCGYKDCLCPVFTCPDCNEEMVIRGGYANCSDCNLRIEIAEFVKNFGNEKVETTCACGPDCACKQDVFPMTMGEREVLHEIEQYIENTYKEHYAKGEGPQEIEMIMQDGHGEGFCLGSCRKYIRRYGHKDGKNRKDLLKLVHYSILALINHDRHNSNETKS